MMNRHRHRYCYPFWVYSLLISSIVVLIVVVDCLRSSTLSDIVLSDDDSLMVIYDDSRNRCHAIVDKSGAVYLEVYPSPGRRTDQGRRDFYHLDFSLKPADVYKRLRYTIVSSTIPPGGSAYAFVLKTINSGGRYQLVVCPEPDALLQELFQQLMSVNRMSISEDAFRAAVDPALCD